MAATVLDRFVDWTLDLRGGDLYGDDERERLRWYEGIATAAQVQGIAVPWAAAIAVWVFGEPVVVPMLVILAAMLVPMWFAAVYVRGKRVDTTPRSWSAKRLLLGVLGGLPIVVFTVGALYEHGPDSFVWLNSLIGAVIGGSIGVAVLVHRTRQRRRAEAAELADVD
jgi:predicted membrane-bound spermidine synthase